MCVLGRPHSTAYAWRAACQERETRATGSGCEGTVRAAVRGLPRIAACDRRAGPCQRAAHRSGVPTQLRRLCTATRIRHSGPDLTLFEVFPKVAASKIPCMRFAKGGHATCILGFSPKLLQPSEKGQIGTRMPNSRRVAATEWRFPMCAHMRGRNPPRYIAQSETDKMGGFAPRTRFFTR